MNYLRTFGDGTTETTTVATEIHAFTTGGSYTYAVTCTDGNESSEISSPQQLKVYAYDLNEVASGTCSTGLRGLGWCWQFPIPTGTSLRAVAADTPLSVWAVGDAGTILSTNDGGITWTPRYASTALDFLAVHTTDHDHVALTASDASVWSTSDAGVTWSSVQPSSGGFSFTSASMANSNDAWAINNGSSIVYTSDGGSSWAPVHLAGAVPSGTQFNSISAGDAKTVWAVGNAPPGTGQTIGPGVTELGLGNHAQQVHYRKSIEQ